MNSGRLVFSQVMDHLPMKAFRRCVQRYDGSRHVQPFTCLDQFLRMAFAQLTFRNPGVMRMVASRVDSLNGHTEGLGTTGWYWMLWSWNPAVGSFGLGLVGD